MTFGALVIFIAAACMAGAGSPAPSRKPTAAPSSAATSAAATVTAAPTLALAKDHGAPIAAVGADLVGAGPMARDPAGNLYLAECDWGHAAVHRIDVHGQMTTYAGTGLPGFDGDASAPATKSRLYCVADVKFGPDGALYLVDHVNNRIRRVDAAGIMTTVAGSGPAGLNKGSYSGDGGPATKATLQEPVAIAFDAAGNLYISDRDNNRIRKVDLNGIITTIAGNGASGYNGDGIAATEASISLPLDLVVDGVGNVIFADSGNHRVRTIDHQTGIITTIETSLATPQYLIFDRMGYLYLEETSPIAFKVLDGPNISTVEYVGGSPIAPSQVPGMNGWLVGKRGELYVTNGASVLRFDHSGKVTLIAGVR